MVLLQLKTLRTHNSFSNIDNFRSLSSLLLDKLPQIRNRQVILFLPFSLFLFIFQRNMVIHKLYLFWLRLFLLLDYILGVHTTFKISFWRFLLLSFLVQIRPIIIVVQFVFVFAKCVSEETLAEFVIGFLLEFYASAVLDVLSHFVRVAFAELVKWGLFLLFHYLAVFFLLGLCGQALPGKSSS